MLGDMYLIAQHVPGKTNPLATRESREFQDETDWKLDPQVIQPFLSGYRTSFAISTELHYGTELQWSECELEGLGDMPSPFSEPVSSGAVLLPSSPYFSQNPADPHQVHPMYPRLHLGVFLVSSNVMKQMDFLKMLPTYSSQQLVPPHLRSTNLVGGVGAAGVL